jgi:hypothetical protein
MNHLAADLPDAVATAIEARVQVVGRELNKDDILQIVGPLATQINSLQSTMNSWPATFASSSTVATSSTNSNEGSSNGGRFLRSFPTNLIIPSMTVSMHWNQWHFGKDDSPPYKYIVSHVHLKNKACKE